MPRPQFTLRALLVAMLVVSAFFGGVHVGERRPRPKDAASIAAAFARADAAELELSKLQLEKQVRETKDLVQHFLELKRKSSEIDEAEKRSRATIENLRLEAAQLDALEVELMEQRMLLRWKPRSSFEDKLDKVDAPRHIPGGST